MARLRDRTISGIFWSFLQKIGSRGIAFIVMILLARLLSPSDIGSTLSPLLIKPVYTGFFIL
jgi:O-antigen/teichoic acid export membrane protein